MKILFITFGIIAIGIIGWEFSPNYSFLYPNTAASILSDKTDSFISKPDAKEILAFLDLDNYQWGRTDLRVQKFTNFNFTKKSEISLPQRVILISNPIERQKEIDQFKGKVTDEITAINQDSTGRPKSTIFLPLIWEVNRIAATDADRKFMVVYSDLQENTASFSVYNDSDLVLLRTHPEMVKKRLEQLAKPNDLNDVKVYFIFEPRTDADNEYFSLMSSLLKEVLTSAGATVHIEANLITEKN